MADPADGARHSMAYVEETTAGTTPSSPGFQTLRHNSTSLGLSKNTLQSEELRSDRQVSHFRHGTRQVGGDIVGELSYGTFDDFLAAVLCDDWQTDTPTAGEDTLVAGTKRKSFTIERYFEDIGQYLRYKGCQFNTLSLSISPDAIVQATFGVTGLDQADPAQTIITGATYSAETTSEPMDSFSGTIKEGGSALGIVTELSLSLENGLEAQYAVGSEKAAAISIGRSNLTGNVTVYFESATLLNKFINETESTLSFVLSDGTDQYEFTLPRIKYNGGQPDVGGPGPVTLSLPIQALYDDTEGTQIKIVRGPAA